MKITLSWLKEYLDTTADLKAITDKLTSIGLEVESVIDHGAALAPFVIAYVESAEQHPNADRLKVCKVNDNNQTYQIVCGAPNARAGIKAVLSLPGMVIPSTGEPLKKGNIRGVESQGMLCAIDELGLGPETTGIIELPEDAPVGKPYAKTYGLDDAVIEIKLTPNRADCTGIYGIARDLAAAGLGTLKPLQVPKISGKGKSPINVKLDTPDCPMFVYRYIKGVKNGPSPKWLQKKLTDIGLRPISALVDVTNYFTMAYGRPMHVFDADRIKGDMHVYSSKGGEKFEALNHKEYTLPADLIAIKDDAGMIALAGVMGGTSSGSDENTKNVLLEVALWNPIKIAMAGRALDIQSDARYRLERGVDPTFAIPATDMASQMILDLCGGEPGELMVSGKEPQAQKTVDFRLARAKTLGGFDIAEGQAKNILTRLGFTVSGSGESWKVTPPPWRVDIDGEADLVEELLRFTGLDAVPAVSLPIANLALGQAMTPMQKRASAAKRLLASRGLLELVSFSFVSRAQAELFGGGQAELQLLNPISADLDQMRPSVLPCLMQAVKLNADRSMPDLALFEVGPCYKGVKEDQQSIMAGLVRSGSIGRHWQDKDRAVNAFDVKADVIALLSDLGVDAAKAQITEGEPVWYHPGQSGTIKFGPNVLAQFGVLHPKILAHYDIKVPVVAAEIFLNNIPAPKSKGTKARTLLKLSQFQPVSRDFAFLVDQTVTADQLVKAAREADKNLIVDVMVFDQFIGKGVGDGKKSLAIAVTIQPTEKTMTDAEIESISKKIVDAVCAGTGAQLRS